MSVVHVHIGTHKTGTTALQHYLAHNRDRLAGAGWLYPRSGCPATNHGHHLFARSLLGRGVFDVARLRREIDGAGVPNVVLSSEEFSLCEAPQAVRQALAGYDVRIVVYCRRQDDLALSIYNQRVKVGMLADSVPQFAARLEREGRLDHYQLCARWADVFGDERLTAAIYRRSISVIDDFFARVGLPKGVCISPPAIHANPSVDARLVGALRIVGQLKQPGAKDARQQRLAALVREAGQDLDSPGTYTLMTRAQRLELLRRFDESNRRFFARFTAGQGFDEPSTEEGERVVDENYIDPMVMRRLMLRLQQMMARQ